MEICHPKISKKNGEQNEWEKRKRLLADSWIKAFCRKISGHEESQQFLGTYNSPEVDEYVSPFS